MNIFSSNIVFDSVLAANWTFNAETAEVLNKPIPKPTTVTPHTSEVITELVYVGPLTQAGGVKIFCDAIDALTSELHAAKVKLTFLVPSPSSTTFSMQKINDMKPDEYIELRSLNWDASDLTWTFESVSDLDETVNYLTKMGRLAVIPGLNDPVAAVAQALVHAKVPLIVSGRSALRDVLAEADRNRVLVGTDGASFADKVKKILDGTDAIPVVRSIPISSVTNWIKFFESGASKSCKQSYQELAEKPLVSVVLVHHNRHQLLKQAIASLNAQTYQNFEVILVDDGSTDANSLSYLRELSWKWWETKGWKVLFESNRYLGAARNTGAKAAAGKFILFLDDDDYSKPHHIETLMKVAINTKSDIVTGGHDVFSGRSRPTNAHSNSRFVPIGPAPLVGMLQNVYGDSAMLVRRDYFVDVGGFTEDFGVGFEDYEFLARAALKGHKIQSVPESLHWYRHHGKTMSTTTNLKTNQLRMLRPYIESNSGASAHQQAVFAEVQKVFFDTYGTAFNEDAFLVRRDYNTTQPGNPNPPVVTPVNPYQVACKAFWDYTGKSAITIPQQVVWTHNTQATCWNLGANSVPTTEDPTSLYINQAIQVLYPNGTSAGFPILQVAPCESGYSDVWNLLMIVVDASTPLNNYKTFESLDVTGAYSFGYFNRPLVPPQSIFDNTYGGELPVVQQGWCHGNQIYFADFNVVPGSTIYKKTIQAGTFVNVNGSGPVSSDASAGATGITSLDPTGAARYQNNDFRSYKELTYPYVPVNNIDVYEPNPNVEILNCPFISLGTKPVPAVTHKTSLFGLQPEISNKVAGVTVYLWGASFTSASVVYVNGVAYSGKPSVISSEYISIVLDFTQYTGETGSVSIYVDDSLVYIVRYYSVPAIVNTITHSTLYTTVRNQVIDITGNNLPQLTGGFCVFNFTENGIAMPLTVTSATSAYCSLPATATSGIYSVTFAMAASKFVIPGSLLVEGNYYQYPTLTVAGGTPLTVMVVAKGPKIVSAQFTESGAGIYVDLDSPASIINVAQYTTKQTISFVDSSYPLPCSAVFATEDNGSLTTPPLGKLSDGVQGDCFVQQLTGTRLKILLQASFAAYDSQAIVPSNSIRILVGSLWAANQTFCLPSQSETVVLPPVVFPTPDVSIIAPSFIPSCNGIILPLDTTSTTGSAGRNYTSGGYQFTSGTAGPTGAASALNIFLGECFAEIHTKAVCDIPITLLWADTFTFTLTLTNYLGGTGSASATVIVGSDTSTPFVTLSGIPGENAKINQFQILDAQATQQCGVNKTIEFEWSVDAKTCPGLVSTETNTTSQLVIPPFGLRTSTTCTVTLRAKYTDQSTWYTATPSFKTASEILEISAGSSRTVGATESLRVDASLFSDAYSQPNPVGFKCAWTCTDGVTGFLCPLSVVGMFSGCVGNDLTARLGVGKFDFHVAVLDTLSGVKSTSATAASINVVIGNVPAVQIALPRESTSPYSNKFALTAVVDPASVSDVTKLKYSWSDCGDSAYSKLDFTRTSNFLTDITSAQVLKFAPGILLPDTRYCVVATVMDGANVATASQTFTTYEVPFGGFCRLQASSVAEISEPLQYSCPYWSLDPSAQPLNFQFMVRQDGQSTWTQISPTTRSSQLSSIFAAGNYQIQVAVTDEYGSTISGVASSFASSVTPKSNSYATSLQCSSTVCYILQNAVASFAQTHNCAAAASAIGSAALHVNVTSPDFITILSLLDTFVSDVYIDTTAIGPFLSSVLQTVAGQHYEMPATAVNSFLNLVGSIVERISESGQLEYPPNCVNIMSAENLFLTLDQTLGTYSGIVIENNERQAAVNQFNSALERLEGCFSRIKAPQEIPYSFNAGYLTRQVGSTFTYLDSSFCNFNVSSNGAQTTDPVVSYSCGTKRSAAYPNTGANHIAGCDNYVEDLTIRDSYGKDVGSKVTNFTIPVTPDFNNNYDLSSSNSHFKAVCAYYQPGTGDYSQDGCTTVSVKNGVVTCSCTHLTDFVVGALVTEETTGLNIGFIVACVIGALALVVVTAGTVYHIRKQQAQKQADAAAAAAGSLLPTTTPAFVTPEAPVPLAPPPATPLSEVVTPTTPVKPIMEGMAAAAAVAATAAVVAAAVAVAPHVRPLPSYSRPPSYDYHMSKMSR
ncbi:hypothetical protein BC830DRAFT_78739 [Chytriomyces sp. MP71]|nr:hypothetical protein BC830DRAFT_78739 [Chytriomyces sp. MP71]